MAKQRLGNISKLSIRHNLFRFPRISDYYAVGSDLATERERQLTTGKRAERTNATSGAQSAALPLVKMSFRSAHVVISAVALSLLNLPNNCHYVEIDALSSERN